MTAHGTRQISTVRIVADGEGLGDWVPPLPSRHVELLQRLPPRDSDTWASRTVRTLLEAVQDDEHGVLIYPISVIDAWTEGEDAFCVVYTPRLGPDLVGVRRRRGDMRPDRWAVRNPGRPDYAADRFDPATGLLTPDEPDEYAWAVADDISDSLGIFGKHLRYDANGLGWWGTLADEPPSRSPLSSS